jgi:hypothetical protein
MTDIDEEFDANAAIFGDDVDLDEIPDDPNYIPEGVYLCSITGAVLKKTAKGDKVGMTIKYQIIAGEYDSAFPFTEWLWVPRVKPGEKPTPEETRARSRMMNHFLAYGFPKDEHKTIQPSHLVDRQVKVQTRNKKQDDGTSRINIVNVLSVDDDILTSAEKASGNSDLDI